ncbi:MAG: chorismate mutase [Acholeplasmatales bacterium]|nr:chorismate mutase [Acholeplasmatales bacterium]
MNKLESARLIINECDKEMIELFKKRMRAAEMVASYKKENNLPVLDLSREEAIINKNIALLNDKEFEEYYLEFFKTMLKVSKDYQTKLMEK